jgi:hypothetical protein
MWTLLLMEYPGCIFDLLKSDISLVKKLAKPKDEFVLQKNNSLSIIFNRFDIKIRNKDIKLKLLTYKRFSGLLPIFN